MKDNLIGLFKSKDKRRKRNNKKNGKKDKKPELTCSIKFMTIDKERSDNIKRPSKKNLDKSNRINSKLKEE